MTLWMAWWDAIWLLRPAFSRLRSFMWFATAVAGLTVRTELLGVTSIVRALKLRPALYNKLRDSLHSDAVQLDRLSALWTQAVLRLFPDPLRVNGRRVLVGDGIKVAKSGKKMPGVKLLHQQSDSNTKPEYIMGHSMQAVSILVRAAQSVFAVPLAVRIHEGLVWSNRDRRTLLDKMISLLGIVSVNEPFYFVADALLRCWQNRQRPARSGQPPGHTREVQCSRLCPVRAARSRANGAAPGSTVPRSNSNRCCLIHSPYNQLPAQSMASTTSPSNIGSAIYCGRRADGSFASWQ